MIIKKKIALLGAAGFVGTNILQCVRDSHDTIQYPSSLVNFTDKSTFNNFKEDDVTIIDCITQIDNKEEILQTNYLGLSGFINYLMGKRIKFNYVYFSSLSTLDESLRIRSTYVKSKYLAETFVQDAVEDHKIIRLSYPFGQGENPNRLLPRLIRNIVKEIKFEINNCPFHFTPIDSLKAEFLNLVSNDQKIIDFIITPAITLKEVCMLFADELEKPLHVSETRCTNHFEPKNISPSYNFDQLVYSLTSYVKNIKTKNPYAS